MNNPFLPKNCEGFAACCVVLRDGKILAVDRKRGKPGLGLPGGKNDYGETLRETAVRELFEETGLVADDVRTQWIFVKKEGNTIVETYLVPVFKGEPTDSDEGTVHWVEPEALLTGAFPEYNAALLDVMKQNGLIP